MDAIAIAANRAAPVHDRLRALADLAIDAARRQSADPRCAELLDDAPLVDAAIGAGLTGALTALALALGDALAAADRRYLVQVIVGAGATGLHVAALALTAGEPELAARAAAAELAQIAAADAPVVARILESWRDAADPFWHTVATVLGPTAEPLAGAIAPHAPEIAVRLLGSR